MLPLFLRQQPAVAVFAILATTTSGFGQTFFVSLFGAEVRQEFGLSHGTYGATYGLATLAAAALLYRLGARIDRDPLPRFTAQAILILAAGCVLVGMAPHVLLLAAGFLLIRLGGQGLIAHIGLTVAGRSFERQRGSAMAFTVAGFPLAEALLPAGAAWLLLRSDWRQPWLTGAILLLAGLLPILLLLARRVPALESLNTTADARHTHDRATVLRDPGFWRILPAALATPAVVTALLFHQTVLAGLRGWPLETVAAAFTLFAGGHLLSLLLAGPIVDRFGAQSSLARGLLLLGAAMVSLALVEAAWAPWLYLGLTGSTLGLTSTANGALWPERYGIHHLGAIRSMTQTAMVISTALAPIGAGLLLDLGIGVRGFGLLSGAGVLLAARACRQAPAPSRADQIPPTD